MKIDKDSNVSYDHSFYDSEELSAWSEAYASKLPKKVNLLVSSGASGCAIASAILVRRPDLTHIHVHPKDRTSHRGNRKQLSGLIGLGKFFAFVDDFVQTGATAINTIKDFKEKHPHHKLVCILVGHRFDSDINSFGVPIICANGQSSIKPRKSRKS